MTTSSLVTSDVRELADGELDQVSGGLWALAWFGYCIAVGVATGYAIEGGGGGGGGGSAPGDYPTGPKNTG